MMRLIRCSLFTLLGTQAERVEIHESDVDSDESNNTGVFLKAKLDIADIAEAEKKFRGGDYPILMKGEKVEMAFNNGKGLGKNDWLLFTNWRSIHCDAKMVLAKINKWEYTSRLWYAYHTAEASTAGTFDRDCEITMRPRGPQWEFAKKIGNKKLFEILDYVNKKLEGSYDQRSKLLKDGAKLLSQHWWKGNVPQLASRSMPTQKSVGDILGEAAHIISSDEKVLYKFEEFKKVGRPDELIVTDKKVIKVDKQLSRSKLHYQVYPYPPGGSLFKFIHEWKVQTAGSGLDFDCELSATSYFDYKETSIIMVPTGNGVTPVALPGPWETIKIDFDKRKVKDAQLFEYHTTLQEQIAKATGFSR